MASSTLLSGENARRIKPIEGGIGNDLLSDQNINREVNLTDDNTSTGSDWKMVLSEPDPNQTPQTSDTLLDHNQPVFVAFHSLLGMETVNYAQAIDESGKMASTHISNPSSLVTSLNSSREGSPDRTGLSMVYSKTEPKFNMPPVGSWMPSTQLRPALSMTHMPMFAAWSDT